MEEDDAAGHASITVATGSNVFDPSLPNGPVAAIVEALQFQQASTSQLELYDSEIDNGTTLTEVAQQVLQEPFTQNVVDAVIREYLAAFDRNPDQGGLSYWVNEMAAGGPNALANLSTTFANSQEFFNLYGVDANAPASVSLVEALYQNILGRPGDAGGIAYWSSQNLDAAQLLQAFVQSSEFIADSQSTVAAYEQTEIQNLVATNNPNSQTAYFGSESATLNITLQPTGTTSTGIFAQTTLVPEYILNAPFSSPTLVNFSLDLQHPAGTNPAYEGWAGATAANSLVNVAAATSLAQALDIAAGDAVNLDQQFSAGAHTTVSGTGASQVVLLNSQTTLADWFQYNGNTYIVEANNTGPAPAAHSALGTTDAVVELVGIIDVTHVGITFT